MLFYQAYKRYTEEVEAAQFYNIEGNVAEVVQNLLDAGVRFITVNIVPNFPQQENSTLITAITFLQNGVSQTLFEGDFIVFDNQDNAIVWNEDDFLANFLPVVSEGEEDE
jgi:hypothetical protein